MNHQLKLMQWMNYTWKKFQRNPYIHAQKINMRIEKYHYKSWLIKHNSAITTTNKQLICEIMMCINNTTTMNTHQDEPWTNTKKIKKWIESWVISHDK